MPPGLLTVEAVVVFAAGAASGEITAALIAGVFSLVNALIVGWLARKRDDPKSKRSHRRKPPRDIDGE
jgi:hypothetical protein